jgi:hypothetical protein
MNIEIGYITTAIIFTFFLIPSIVIGSDNTLWKLVYVSPNAILASLSLLGIAVGLQ